MVVVYVWVSDFEIIIDVVKDLLMKNAAYV